MWSSIESLTKLKTALDLIVILSGLLTAGGAVGLWVISNRLDTLKEARDADRRLTVEQKTKSLTCWGQAPRVQ